MSEEKLHNHDVLSNRHVVISHKPTNINESTIETSSKGNMPRSDNDRLLKKVRSVGAFEICSRAKARETYRNGLASEFSVRAATCSSTGWVHKLPQVGCSAYEDSDDGYGDACVSSPLRKVSSWSGPHAPRCKRSCSPSYATSDEPENEDNSFSCRDLPRFLAKISAIILVVAAIADLASSSEHSFLFHASSTATRPSLGSAAIKSVTETLSPILPFTGGIDLRKEDYWTSSSPFETIQSITSQVWEAFTASDAVDPMISKQSKLNSTLTRGSTKIKIAHAPAIGASECFAHLDDIAQLTLEDVSQVIHFAVESNRPKFDETRFLGRQQPRIRKVIQALDQAVKKSRGKGVQISLGAGADPKQPHSPGSTDALMFAAAMRVFGEWRMLRQVPEGYKSYAMGMNIGLKDIVQNVAKVELAAHNWLDSFDAPEDGILRSPTIGQLMEYEAECGVHPHLPRLKDRTGAMGLLWVRRQLQYQTQIFENVIQEKRFPSTTEAVSAAYDKVYNQYHGWAVQKIFTYSFQSAPDADAVYRHMNPHKLQELREGKLPIVDVHATDSFSDQVNVSNTNEDNPFLAWVKNFEKDLNNNPVVSWFKKVGDDSRRLVEDIRDKLLQVDDGTIHNNNGSAVEEYISREMAKNARENILVYLETIKPLLSDLAEAFKHYNMDDPTKV